MAEARIKIDRRAALKMAKDPGVLNLIEAVANDAADDIEGRADQRVMDPSSARVFTRQTDEGTEVVMKSPIWHWQEFGAAHYPSRPFIRPGVQRALAKVKGRFTAQ